MIMISFHPQSYSCSCGEKKNVKIPFCWHLAEEESKKGKTQEKKNGLKKGLNLPYIKPVG